MADLGLGASGRDSVCICLSFPEKERAYGPLVYQIPGPGSWLGRVWIPSESILGVSRMLVTGPCSCPQLSRPLPLGNPALPGRVTQAEIRAGRRLQSWAIYGHTLGPPGPHPHCGTGQLVRVIQALFRAAAGVLSIYSMFLWDRRRRTQFWDSPGEQGLEQFFWLQS